MEHYTTDRWVDFARDLVGKEQRTAMEAHLAAGCTKCRRRADVFGRLAATAEAEAAYDVPAEVLGRAAAICSRPVDEGLSGRTPIVPRLVYDSFRDPLPAGVRASDRPSRALYEAENYSLDLHLNRERLDREHGAPRMVLVGQIADRREPGKRLTDLPVLLMAGKQVAAHGVSNQLGEFHLEYDPEERLHLEIPIDDGKRIEIPLPRSHEWGRPS